MKVVLDRRPAHQITADALLLGTSVLDAKSTQAPRPLAREDELLGGAIHRAVQSGELTGKARELTVFHRTDRPGRIVVVGLGARPLTVDQVRDATGVAIQKLQPRGARSVVVRLDTFVGDSVVAEAATRAVADGLALGGYTFGRYQTVPPKRAEEATIALGETHSREEPGLRAALQEELSILDAALWTRDVANVPANEATPEWVAATATRLGKEFGLKVTVLDEAKLKELGCGGLLAVGSGSAHPPRLVVVEHPGAPRRGQTVAVVGKGITFDSGGISIKPSLAMGEMKFDKAGACAVLGILRVAAALRLTSRVVGVLALAENLPSGAAYRPGDVVKTFSGTTIEVLDTDAEGRVVLADALGYVKDKYKPDEIIDLATLTGAQLVALGENIGALVGNDDRLATALVSAGQASGEPLWRLPLTDPHREMVKSDVADVRNVVEPRYAGVLIGAAFLERFVGKTPWAHLDIAGPAYTRKGTLIYAPGYHPLGATGFGVRLVAEYLRGLGR